MAGNAVGLGNFLRFPRQAALNGGGAFMIPYFTALVIIGIPLMWAEWSMGRLAGSYGHSTTVGLFEKIIKGRLGRYIGSLGISLPLTLLSYYCCIEAWTFAYAFFSATKAYFGITNMQEMNGFLQSFQGITPSAYFSGPYTLIVFWIITIVLNTWVIAHGISKGIERLAKIAMPLLLLFAIILVIRVITIGTPDPSRPENSVASGFAFLWNPDFSKLKDMKVWLAAAGQIFFTLSIGMGTIQCYASYLKRDDDCILTGLATSASNEFCEVVLGGSIAIPISVAFLGLATTAEIAKQGSFDLGFVAMPIIFQRLPLGFLFGSLWFLLLFFAGITSSVALAQPMLSFLHENLGIKRKKAALALATIMFVFGLPNILFIKNGYLDQSDFWIGTVSLVAFALIESVLFAWVFGEKNMWEELNRGAAIRVPRVFYYIIRYIVPIGLGWLLVSWIWQDITSSNSNILLKGMDDAAKFYAWLARGAIILIIAMGIFITHIAQKRGNERIHGL
jgi:SNF family Na+-dependent transporter